MHVLLLSISCVDVIFNQNVQHFANFARSFCLECSGSASAGPKSSTLPHQRTPVSGREHQRDRDHPRERDHQRSRDGDFQRDRERDGYYSGN